jgi:predicted amino acid racemase
VFLELLERRNPDLVSAAVRLHREGLIDPNSYVIDLDAVTRNARQIGEEAARLDLEVFAMTKQVGRGAPFADAVREGGIERVVAVDMACAMAADAAGIGIGHIGHLVQIPSGQADAAAALRPDNWTVFNKEKAREAAAASEAIGADQDLLARIVGSGDFFYEGHEGGFDAGEVVGVADGFDELGGASFAGITTFPALLFDAKAQSVRATPNLATLSKAAGRLRAAGRDDIRVNAPGTTSTSTLQLLADAGATQVEPGHGLTGTTPWHAFADLPEEPAVLYLTEVSHHAAGRTYCFGGGFYIDPVLGDSPVRALVSEDAAGEAWQAVAARLPEAGAIDYYGMLEPPEGGAIPVGASVIFGFRIQAFVTRSVIVGLRGVGTEDLEIAGAWRPDGMPTAASLGPASPSGTPTEG